MGKKQHQKDKLWLTNEEWRTLYGGKKAIDNNKNRFRRLPYYYCSLKFQPALNACCTKEGIVFDMENILEYIKKHKINPVTGEKMKMKDLIKLKFHKNLEGEMHCPITYKPFNDNSRIVAVPCSGNVFSLDGLTVSNLKTEIWRDPLSEEEFHKKDLINIQDPDNLEKFNMSSFYHTKNDAEEKEETGPSIRITNSLTAETMKEIQKMEKERKVVKKAEEVVKKDSINEAHYSTGMVSASFTSTTAPVAYTNESAILPDDTIRYARVTEKGYVTMITNFGKINLELHCDLLPKTCENFIKLCKKGYYNNTKFHRLIRHFILQGGDPTGTGKGGQSIWGEPFADEFLTKLSHNARGLLAMANSGPNTNKSQFFVVLRPAKHLDQKHTVFGKIVGGLKVLDEIEMVESDNQDRPIEPIEIIATEVFLDPFEKVDDEIKLERERLENNKINPVIDESLKPRNKKEEEEMMNKKLKGTLESINADSKVVGKFIPSMKSDDIRSVTSKKVSGIKRALKDDDSEEEDEYSKKVRLRMLESKKSTFIPFMT